MQVGYGKSETMDTVNDTAGTTGSSDDLASQMVYQLSGTWSGVVTFQCTLNGTDWVSVLAYPSTSTTGATTATANGIYRVDFSGYWKTQVKFTTDTSGTVEVTTNPVIG